MNEKKPGNPWTKSLLIWVGVLFGLVPATVIGAPLNTVFDGGVAMAEGCRQNNHKNAGLELGAFIAAAAMT